MALRRYTAASEKNRLGIDELFDLYEEVSSLYLHELLDDAIFEDQIGPQLVVDWRIGHWLVNYLRVRSTGRLDVDVYGNWQRVYVKMIERPIQFDPATDSDPHAGDYDLLQPLPTPSSSWLWPDRIRWEGFRRTP